MSSNQPLEAEVEVAAVQEQCDRKIDHLHTEIDTCLDLYYFEVLSSKLYVYVYIYTSIYRSIVICMV